MDPIADMLTIIRNGLATKKESVKVPFSNLKLKIAEILEREGWIEKAEKKGRRRKYILLKLKYDKDGNPVISGLKRVSKQGQRIYKGYKEIKKVKGGYGIAIVSTSKGVLTDKEARKKRVGGEIICEIW